ncbi:MAG: TrmH family RNA methyltransferase, partial [Planctomycetota bacterium]
MRRVVLCRPEGPRNVGTALRITRNFGPCELVLVAPERASLLIHPEFEQMSHGVEGRREAVRVVDTLEEALADCTRVVGFTARVRGGRVRRDWRLLAPELVGDGVSSDRQLALVFGNEVSGMTIEETNLCHDLTHVRTSDEHTSLNLAVTVAVALSAIFGEEGVCPHEPGGHPLNGAGREFLKSRMKEIFSGRIAQTPAASLDIAESIDRVFSRAPLENKDARAWHLMLKALGSKASPTDMGLYPNVKGGRRIEALSRRE